MGNFRGWEWILILLLALLLFGGFKKLPDAARGVGRSLRIFKAETKGLVDDDADTTPDETVPAVDAATTPKVEAAAKPTAVDASNSAEAKNSSTPA
ncbi:MAG: Sec-independent protein translocase subunit TatA [Candidatus Nanopelagicales bacterium]